MTEQPRTRFTVFALIIALSTLFAGTPAWADPSNVEQLMIYELNRARNRPARYDKENNLGGLITTTLAQPPLAVSDNLVNSASFHAEEMANNNYFAHTSAVTGDQPNKMARDAGYVLPTFYQSAANNIESLAAGTFIDTALEVLNLLIIDAGVNPPGHRIHLLATSTFFQSHREIGVGSAFNGGANFDNYHAIHTAVRESGGNQFLTGVVYNDANSNKRYDLGEGLGGVTVSNGGTSVQTNAAGGWSIAVAAGAYTVTASGGAYTGTGTAKVIVSANRNVEIDFISGNSSGEIDFVRQNNCALFAAVDIDKDCKADIGIFRDGAWVIIRSSDNTNSVSGVGGPGWTPVPADYDGDGQTDAGAYLNGTWVIVRSSDAQTVVAGAGGPAFVPVPGDYDGDGKADIAVYSAGVWSITRSSDGGNTIVAHGGPGWIPVPADYDGDGKTDVAVYINGAWSINRSSDAGNTVIAHGGPPWTPLPADYDGDGRADAAVYLDGAWSVRRTSDGGNTVVGHGGPAWTPVPADYDGDGKTDIGVYLGGAWSVVRSTDNGFTVVGHGGGLTDIPLN